MTVHGARNRVFASLRSHRARSRNYILGLRGLVVSWWAQRANAIEVQQCRKLLIGYPSLLHLGAHDFIMLPRTLRRKGCRYISEKVVPV